MVTQQDLRSPCSLSGPVQRVHNHWIWELAESPMRADLLMELGDVSIKQKAGFLVGLLSCVPGQFLEEQLSKHSEQDGASE